MTTKTKFPIKTVAAVAATVAVVGTVSHVSTPILTPTVQRAIVIPPHTNRPPPSQTIGFNLPDPLYMLAGVEAYVGHASGQFTTAFFIPSSALSNMAQYAFTLTNINLQQPYSIQLQEVSTNGFVGAPSAPLWFNVVSNGQVYSLAGNWYLGFVETNWGTTNFTWKVSPAMPDGPAFYSNTPGVTTLAQVALPRPGYYRITRE